MKVKPVLSLLFFLLLTVFTSSAQNKLHAEIDSLQLLIDTTQNDSVRIRYITSVGHRYVRLNDFPKAMETFNEGLKASLEIGHLWGVADAYNNIHWIYFEEKNWEKAEEALQSSLKIFQELGDSMQIAMCYNNLGNLRMMSGDVEGALPMLERTLVIKQAIADEKSIYNTQSSIARVYKHMGKDEEALRRFSEVLELRRKIGDVDGEINSLMSIGGVYVNQENYDQAIVWVLEALAVAKKSNRLRSEMDCHQGLSMFYSANKDYENAFNSQSVYFHLRDSVINAKNTARLKELEVQYETEKKERELALEKERKEAALARSSFLLKLMVLSIVSVILIAGIIVLFIIHRNRTQRELARQKSEQLTQKMKLETLNALIKGQEGERKRIAQDLHDGLGGLLATLRMRLPLGTNDHSGERDTSLLVDEVCVEVRRIAHNMMPEVLLKFGLEAAIEDLAQKINAGGKLEVQVQSYGLQQSQKHNENFDLPVYRIVQELVHNAIKHASATEILIQLNQVNNNLNITVEDNGVGFDPVLVSQKKTMGMQSLKSRIHYLNGYLNIDSRPGNGTSVMVDLPVTVLVS